jgi:hypothetical protein
LDVITPTRSRIGAPKRAGAVEFDAAHGTHTIGGGRPNHRASQDFSGPWNHQCPLVVADSKKLVYVRYQPEQ